MSNITNLAGQLLTGAGVNGALSLVAGAINNTGLLSTPDSAPEQHTDPEQLSGPADAEDALRALGFLKFPGDLDRSYIKFQFVEYKRQNVNSEDIESPLTQIYLPLPANLGEAFGMRYNDVEIGAILGHVADNGEAFMKKMMELGMNSDPASKSKRSDVVADLLKNTFGNGRSEEMAKIVGGNMVKAFSQGAGALVDQFIGGVPNPRLALLYQGHGFRQFSFNWRLVPRNVKETVTLEKIITVIKHCMHPRQQGLFFYFPMQCKTTIMVGNQTANFMKIKRSVVESFNVNYAPSGTPAFYSSTKRPVEIELQMTLKETELFTRDDFPVDQAFGTSEGE